MMKYSSVVVQLVMTSAFVFLLGGCANGLIDKPLAISHPANPQAKAAPVAQLPDTLNVKSIERPQREDDPHAGHNM